MVIISGGNKWRRTIIGIIMKNVRRLKKLISPWLKDLVTTLYIRETDAECANMYYARKLRTIMEKMHHEVIRLSERRGRRRKKRSSASGVKT